MIYSCCIKSASSDASKSSSVVKRRSKASAPKLTVLSVIADGQVECQLDFTRENTREKTVTFVFNHNEMTATEVADKLVSSIRLDSHFK